MYMAHQLNMINYKNANLRNKKWTNLRICQNGEKLWNLFYFQHNFIYLILYCISLNARMKRYKLSICKKLKKIGNKPHGLEICVAAADMWPQWMSDTHTHTSKPNKKYVRFLWQPQQTHAVFVFAEENFFKHTKNAFKSVLIQ